MAGKKPKPKPTVKFAIPGPNSLPEPKVKATPKTMKSPKPPQVPNIPKGTPEWQKNIINQNYYDDYRNYLDLKKEWSKQQKGKK